MSATVYLSIGSNIGDRAENLRRAIAQLPLAHSIPVVTNPTINRAADEAARAEKPPKQIVVTRISSFYETEPVDFLDQDWFINCAVELETELGPLDLLHALQAIETQMGRKKSVPKGPRLIDIDILLYANEIVDTPDLHIPHPSMHLRRFVLVPLNEIAPGALHPRLKRSVAELMARLQDTSKVRLLASGT